MELRMSGVAQPAGEQGFFALTLFSCLISLKFICWHGLCFVLLALIRHGLAGRNVAQRCEVPELKSGCDAGLRVSRNKLINCIYGE
jgi:hypothetical protein